jgi:hypothetical protein
MAQMKSVKWTMEQSLTVAEALPEEFYFDEDGDNLLEESQRKLLIAKKSKPARRQGDWD